MTDNFSGESDIESLAQRAKEVLDRVRSHTVEGAAAAELPDVEFEPLAEPETNMDVDVDVEPEADFDVEPLAGIGLNLDGEPEADVEAELDLAPAAAVEVEPKPSPSTDLVAMGAIDTEDLLIDTEEESSRRKLGCLLPLLLLALLVLAFVLFGDRLVGSDDEEDALLVDPPVTTVATDVDIEQSTVTTSVETTAAPEPTVESTDPPATEPPIPSTAWELLSAENDTDQFAVFGGPLGLRELLEQIGDDAEFTLLAPSNTAMDALSTDEVAALNDDPAAAGALIGYHIIDQRLAPDLLLENAGGQIESRVGLPIDVAIDGGDIVLNGQSRVSIEALEAENGNVLVIDSILSPPSINSAIQLGEVQFEVISSIITPEGQNELQKAVEFFEENPDANAIIEGHTDTDGPSGPNQDLSDRRANAVRDFLISQGIAAARLTATGFGESQPILVNGVEDKAASRRIEFVLR